MIKNDKLYMVIIMMALFIVGGLVVSMVWGSERHETSSIIVNLPDSGSDCGSARAMAGGQHQYFATTGGQMSISGAYDNDCFAMSVGTAVRTSPDTLITGDISCDDSGDCGGGGNFTIKF